MGDPTSITAPLVSTSQSASSRALRPVHVSSVCVALHIRTTPAVAVVVVGGGVAAYTRVRAADTCTQTDNLRWKSLLGAPCFLPPPEDWKCAAAALPDAPRPSVFPPFFPFRLHSSSSARFLLLSLSREIFLHLLRRLLLLALAATSSISAPTLSPCSPPPPPAPPRPRTPALPPAAHIDSLLSVRHGPKI